MRHRISLIMLIGAVTCLYTPYARAISKPQRSGSQPLRTEAQKRTEHQSSQEKKVQISAGLGLMMTNLSRTTSVNDSSVSTFGPMMPVLTLGSQINLGPIGFAPMFSFSPLGRTDEDGAMKAYNFSFAIPIYKVFSNLYEVKLGTGWLLQVLSGKGGQAELGNGASTQTFYKPNSTLMMGIVFVDLGFGMRLVDQLRLDTDLWMTGLLSGRRAANLLIALSWGFL